MRTKTVSVTMPEWVWGRLASIADNRGKTTADIIASAILATIGETPALVEPRRVHLDEGSFADTGVPGHRAERLTSEVSAARADGYRAPKHPSRRDVA